MQLDDETLKHTVDVYKEAGSVTKAASQLGLDVRTVQRRLGAASRRNVDGFVRGGPTPHGYSLGKVTRLVGPDGVVMEWEHLHPDPERVNEAVETILAAMEARITPVEPLAWYPDDNNDQLMVTYPIPDLHAGQYSWGKETGEDYDTKIAQSQFLATSRRLISRSPETNTALILNLGDHFHADNNKAETDKSHNRLDVDSRHSKVLYLGTEMQIAQIDTALMRHENVIWRGIGGNHDPNSMEAMEMALWFRYQKEPRVTILRGPNPFFFYQWGETMLMAHHGHLIKPTESPSVMASKAGKMWGDTTYRYALMGHWHRRWKGAMANEEGGATWEVFPALTAKDAYNHGKGYSSHRGMRALIYSAVDGLVGDLTEPVHE